MAERLHIIELFGGVGCQATAFENIGLDFDSILCEIDESASRSYMALHGETENLGDITKVEHLPKADMVFYSYPCQAVSISGRHKGMVEGSGTTSSLVWEVIRLLKDAKARGELPEYLGMENVPAVLSKKHRPVFDKLCEALEELGYTNSYALMNAKDYGTPQNRKRLFMVSSLHHGKFVFPEPIGCDRVLDDVLEDDVPEEYYLSQEKIAKYEAHRVRQEENGRNFGWKPLDRTTAKYSNTVTCIVDRHATGVFIKETNRCVLAGKLNGKGHDIINRVYDVNGLSPTITTPSGGGHLPKIDVSTDILAIRTITPREAWRLQGFNDEQIDRAFAVTPSKTQRYKQAGNGIAVPCLEAIFKGMFIDNTWEEPSQATLERWM